MSTAITVKGVVKSDGSLELEEKIPLPAGEVRVTVQPVMEPEPSDPFWQILQKIWDGQNARGHQPSSEEEVEDRLKLLREEWEERQQALEKARRDKPGGQE